MWKLYNFNAFLIQKQHSYLFYVKHAKNDYFPSHVKFEMRACIVHSIDSNFIYGGISNFMQFI
jgi:hypothetical protein